MLASGAHPRSRGENELVAHNFEHVPGSSPLTRGKRGHPERRVIWKGLIPAHAGKTAGLHRGRRGPRAHPRSRGENQFGNLYLDSITGSSPLTRGKHNSPRVVPPIFRLIPAHAGKTSAQPRGAVRRGAHPRSRGENHGVQSRIVNQTGSSPLTRGKQSRWQRAPRLQGLIPAHAGKTSSRASVGNTVTAHPRSRGENRCVLCHMLGVWGSSPLTRGKRSLGWNRTTMKRLIPAHAGKTGSGSSDATRPGAHPRSRGENTS